MKTAAFQGEPGAFSEIAASRYFGPRVTLSPRKSFNDVFSAVSEGSLGFGVVPIENSVFGSIHQNYDLLLKHKLFIVGEIVLRVQLHLMAIPGTKLKDVSRYARNPRRLANARTISGN